MGARRGAAAREATRGWRTRRGSLATTLLVAAVSAESGRSQRRRGRRLAGVRAAGQGLRSGRGRARTRDGLIGGGVDALPARSRGAVRVGAVHARAGRRAAAVHRRGGAAAGRRRRRGRRARSRGSLPARPTSSTSRGCSTSAAAPTTTIAALIAVWGAVTALVGAPAGGARRARGAPARISASSSRSRGSAARVACTGRRSRPAALGAGPVVVKLYRRRATGGRRRRAGARWSLGPVARGRDQRAWLHAVTRVAAGRRSTPARGGGGHRDARRERAVRGAVRDAERPPRARAADARAPARRRRVPGAARPRRAARHDAAGARWPSGSSDGLAFLHRHGIAASDIAPNNLLVAFGAGRPRSASSTATRWRSADAGAAAGADGRLGHTGGVRRAPGHARGRRVQARAGGAAAVRALARRARAGAAPALRPGRSCATCSYRSLGAAAVNRPPAGEWQRALRGLLADGGPERALSRAGAGAACSRRDRLPRRARPVVTPVRSGARPLRPPAPRPWAGPSRAAAAVAPARRRRVWIVAGTVVLLVVLSRLFAAAVPVPESDRGPARRPAPERCLPVLQPGTTTRAGAAPGRPTGIIQVALSRSPPASFTVS